MAASDIITHDRIAEEGAVRDYIGKEFDDLATVTLPAAEEAVKQFAKSLQQSLSIVKFPTDLAGLEKLNSEVEKATKADIAYEKVKQQKLITQQKENALRKSAIDLQGKERKETEAQGKALEKTRRELEKNNSEYQKAVKHLSELKKQLKELEFAGQGQAESTKLVRKEYEELDAKVRAAEQGVGEFQRNVGNYPNTNAKYEASLIKISKGLKGLGSLGGLLARTLGINTEILDSVREAGQIVREYAHAEELGKVATEGATTAKEAEIVVEKEANALKNLSLGVWGLIAVAIVAASYALYKWVQGSGDAVEAWANQNETIKEFKKEIIALNDELEKGNIELAKRTGKFTEYQANQKLARLKEMKDVGEVAKKVREETKKIEDDESGFWITTWRVIKSMASGQGLLGAEIEKAIVVAAKVNTLQKVAENVLTAQGKVADTTLELTRKVLRGKMDDDFETSQAKLKLLEGETIDKKKQLDIQLQMDIAANKHANADLEIRTINAKGIWEKYYKDVAQISFDHEKAMRKIAEETTNQTAAELTKRTSDEARSAIDSLRKNKSLKKESGLFGDALSATNSKYNSQQDEAIERERQQEIEANDAIENTEELNAKVLQMQKELENKLSDIDRARYEELFDLEDQEKERQKALHKEEMARLKEQADAVIDFMEQSLQRKNNLREQELSNELDARQRAVLQQQNLAAAGLQNTLAFQQAALAKAELQKQELAKKEFRDSKRIAFIKLLSSAAEKEKPLSAFFEALTVMGLGEAVTGSYIEGTDKSVGKDARFSGNKVHNGTDGYVARFDGREKIFSPGQSEKIGDMSNDDVAQLAFDYQMGFLSKSGANIIESSPVLDELKEMRKEFASIKEVIKQRPVPSFIIHKDGTVSRGELANGINKVTVKSQGNRYI